MEKFKTRIIFAVFILFTGVIIWRLVYLQIKQGKYYEVLALGQQVSFEENSGSRGNILLLDGSPLAQNKLKKIVYAFSQKIKQEDLDKIGQGLADILGEKKADILQGISSGVFKKEVSDEQAEKIKKENWEGVSVNEVSARFYPHKNLASHLLGFVNDEKNGQYGLEAYYNDILQGKTSTIGQAKSPFGYLVFLSESEQDFSLQGVDLVLTLDFQIQSFAEKILKSAVEKWQADAGQILVEEPSTGKILAAAFSPNFDPNQYSQYSNEDKIGIFLNSSIQKIFEPGSVFKAITMAAGLEEGLVTPDTKYTDTGFVDLGGPLIYNFDKRKYGEQTMTNVLEKSLNTGAAFVEQKLGGTKFLQYAEKFGLFEKTGIDLSGEVFSSNENLKSGYPRDFATASFGQGIEITSMQLVRAFGALANGGKLMKPYLVEKVIENGGEKIVNQPQVQRQAILPETSSVITSMLVSVVENGSGKRVKQKGYYIAGKTGTAQVAEKGKGYSQEAAARDIKGNIKRASSRARY